MVSKAFITVVFLVAMLGLISNAFARSFEVERTHVRVGGGDFRDRHDGGRFHGGDFRFRGGNDFGFRRGNDFGFRRGGFVSGFQAGELAASNRFGTFGTIGTGAVIPGASVVVPGATFVGSAAAVVASAPVILLA